MIHRACQVVGDAWQVAVLQGVYGVAGSVIQPDGRPHGLERVGPAGAEAAGAEMRLWLAAALTPRRANRPPALPADAAYDAGRLTVAEQPMAQQAFGRKEELFECGGGGGGAGVGAKHEARGARRRA